MARAQHVMGAKDLYNLLCFIMLISFATVGSFLYTPALPEVSQVLGLKGGQAQFTMTTFLIGYALAQLPYGPLANAIGRRKAIYLGCGIGLIGSLICALAPVFWLLNLGRVVTSIGMGVGLVITFTIVGDLYQEKKARQMISYGLISFAVLPALGIALGGLLTEYLGWRFCFYALALYCLIIAGLTMGLPRTGPVPDLHHLKLRRAAAGYWEELKHPMVVVGGIMMGLTTSIIYIFATEAPFIGIDHLKLTEGAYGLFTLVPNSGLVLGSLLAAQISRRISLFPMVSIGFSLIGLFSTTMLILFSFGIINVGTLFFLMAVTYFGIPFSYMPLSVAITTRAANKSNASAVMSFCNMGIAALSVLILGLFDPRRYFVMPIFFVTLIAILFCLFFVLRRYERG